MNRVFAIAAVAASSLIVAPGIATATHSSGQGPNHDFVHGSGKLEGPGPFGPIAIHLHVNAKSGPSGEDPKGHLFFDGNPPGFGEINFHGRITCMRTVGNRSTVGGEITNSKAGPPEGSGFVFSFEDVGGPGEGDRFEGAPIPAPPPVCPDLTPTRVFTQGGVVVHNAS